MANNIKYIQQYQKDNTVQVNVRLSKKYDADILGWLSRLDGVGKATYIKKLIREDMAKNAKMQMSPDGRPGDVA